MPWAILRHCQSRALPSHVLSAIDKVREWEKNGAGSEVLSFSTANDPTRTKGKIMARTIRVDLTEIRKLKFVGIAMLALGSLCSGQATSSKADWTQFLRNNMQRYNPYEHVLNVKNVSRLKVKWTYATNARVAGSPAVVDGVVYVGGASGADGMLYAIDARTGGTKWTFPGGFGSPAVLDGVVYTGASEAFYALDARTGAEVWEFPGATGSVPTVADGGVYFCSESNILYALDAVAGTELWEQVAPGGCAAAAVAHGLVYTSSDDDGTVYAWDARTGALVWSYETKAVAGDAAPVVANGIVYAPTNGAGVYAFDARTGAFLWSGPGGTSKTTPAVAGGLLFGSDGLAYALNASTGKTVWEGKPAAESSPALANGVLYFGCGIYRICAVDAKTGKELWTYKTHNSVYSSPSVVDGVVYVGSEDRNVYAFSLK